MITIRRADVSQAEEIARFARKVWSDHYLAIIGKKQIDYMLNKYQSTAQITSDIGHGYDYDIALAQDQIVGYCASRLDENAIFLSKLYVDRSFRNQRIASQFMQLLLNTAHLQNKKTIWLNVNKQNPSVNVYKKMGFITKDSVVSDIGHGYVMDDYIMEYSL